MRDVKKRKTTYKAVNWWGNAQKVEIDNVNDWVALELGESIRLSITEGFGMWWLEWWDVKKEVPREAVLTDGKWIVVSSRGKVEVLEEDDYERKYEDR